MGNLLSRAVTVHMIPNIPMQQGNNNPNRPYTVQMQEMVLNFTVPMLCIAALAYLHSQMKSKPLQISSAPALFVPAPPVITLQKLHEIEVVADRELQAQLNELRIFEKRIESILDIACSPFKLKSDRIKLQEELIARLPRSSVSNVVLYYDLKDIYRYDGLFCGSVPADNGKLRHIYVRLWRAELERNQYRAIVEKLKRAAT